MRSFPAGAAVGAWQFRLLLIAVCVGTGLLSSSSADNYWDLRYYHLYNPWAYLHGRYLYDVGPAQSRASIRPRTSVHGLIASPLNEMPRLVAFIMGTARPQRGLHAGDRLPGPASPEPRERTSSRPPG
jgi:hypothetical protein